MQYGTTAFLLGSDINSRDGYNKLLRLDIGEFIWSRATDLNHMLWRVTRFVSSRPSHIDGLISHLTDDVRTDYLTDCLTNCLTTCFFISFDLFP